jgi:hypothetical protein
MVQNRDIPTDADDLVRHEMDIEAGKYVVKTVSKE